MSSCIDDAFQHGHWLHVQGIHDGSTLLSRNEQLGSLGCSHWEYANSSCGPAMSETRLCRALRCQSVLMVGDSTFSRLFAALIPFGKPLPSMSQEMLCPIAEAGAKRAVMRQARTICTAECPHGGINVSYWRHNHLLAEGLQLSSVEKHESCDAWLDQHILAAHPILIISSGAHLMAYDEATQRRNASWHAARADALANHLQQATTGKVIFVHAHWGAKHWSATEATPISAPERPHPSFGWDLLPMVSTALATRLRQRLGDRLLVIDPTRALAQRPDCRESHMHVRSEVYLASTWRMLQNALHHAFVPGRRLHASDRYLVLEKQAHT